MRWARLLAWIGLLSGTAWAQDDHGAIIMPQEAVARSDAQDRPIQGRFAMQVVSTGRIRGVVYLNSDADYRAPTDLCFRLSPNVASILAKRFGETPEIYLRNRHVVVQGTLRREAIANLSYGRVVSGNRWQHTVRILNAGQILAVD